MTVEETNRLIDKYLEGLTSPEEEQRLALEVSGPDVPQEWLIIRDMLGELTVGEAIYNKVVKSRKRRRWLSYGGWGIAASVALGLVIGSLLPMESADEVGADVVNKGQVAQVAMPETADTVSHVEEVVPDPNIPLTKQVEEKAAPPKRLLAKAAEGKAAESPSPTPTKETTGEEAPSAIEIVSAQVTEADLAQVESNYEKWRLKQAIIHEGIELEIATRELNRKYEAYLAENVIEIEI